MRKYFKYILVFFICGFIFSCTETTSEIKVYSIDGITKIWNKHKNEYIILYNYKNKTPQKRFDAILSYFRKYDMTPYKSTKMDIIFFCIKKDTA